MPPTSSPTSSERWSASRSTSALAGFAAVSVILIALAFAGQAADSGRAGTSDTLFRYEFAVGSLVAYGILVGLTWVIARAFPDRPRAALGLRAFAPRWLGIALALTLLAVVVSTALEPVLHAGEEQGLAPDRWQDNRAPAFALNAAVVVLAVPFAEELFFRGLGVRALGFLGLAPSVLLTAAIFALAHGLPAAIPALGFFALALGYVRYRSESVWPGVIAHASYNLVGILVALYVALDRDGQGAAALGLVF